MKPSIFAIRPAILDDLEILVRLRIDFLHELEPFSNTKLRIIKCGCSAKRGYTEWNTIIKSLFLDMRKRKLLARLLTAVVRNIDPHRGVDGRARVGTRPPPRLPGPPDPYYGSHRYDEDGKATGTCGGLVGVGGALCRPW